jgi:hypothetical protein
VASAVKKVDVIVTRRSVYHLLKIYAIVMMKIVVGTVAYYGVDVLMSAAEDAGSIMTDLIDGKQK